MGEIALAEGHKEAYPFDLGYIKGKRLDFLMVEKIHILPPYFIKVIFTFMLMAGTSTQCPFSQ